MSDISAKEHPETTTGDDSGRFYFEGAGSLRQICSGDEVRLLRLAEERFGVHLVARGNWIDISGRGTAAATGFFGELCRLRTLRGRQLEMRDFELLCRGGSGGCSIAELWEERVKVSPRRREVLARSKKQLAYLRAMRKFDVVFGVGPAGTGKTYLAMAMAVSEFLAGNVSRIVLTRPARESGERLGFLPGTLEEKVSPYLRPLYDALYEMMAPEEVQTLAERNVIEVAPLAFMRGRTLNGAFIILDEAQNTTRDQMLMFLTRMGFGSRCVVTGDPMQSDLAPGESSGLEHALRTLRGLPELGFVYFDTSDVVRHSLLEKIINAYAERPAERKNS